MKRPLTKFKVDRRKLYRELAVMFNKEAYQHKFVIMKEDSLSLPLEEICPICGRYIKKGEECLEVKMREPGTRRRGRTIIHICKDCLRAYLIPRRLARIE